MTKEKKTFDSQIVTKQRVSDHGEVYTSEREVNAMLDLVKQETERIDSRFLEPACGTGNFLVEVLRRKLTIVESRYKKSQLEYERNAIIAISSIYGIDILEDNVDICRERLFDILNKKYTSIFSNSSNPDFLKSIKFVLSKNVILGDALTLKTVGLLEEPIVFSEWSMVLKNKLQRRDFKMTSLLENQPIDGLNLFSDLGEEAFIPIPIKTFPLQSIYKLAEDVQRKL